MISGLGEAEAVGLKFFAGHQQLANHCKPQSRLCVQHIQQLLLRIDQGILTEGEGLVQLTFALK